VTTAPTVAPSPSADELVERLFESALATLELGSVHLGLTLGLYATLHELGPSTSAQLASAADADERYVREWLEQQAVAQLLVCEDDAAAPADRRYAVPTTSAELLLDPTSSAFLAPLAHLAVGMVLHVDQVAAAVRTGDGLPFAAFGRNVRHGLGALNGAAFDRDLPGWIATLPDVETRLRTGTAPAVLDLGCGTGRSAFALASAFPRASVRGVDLDPRSVEEARAGAARRGLADRVTFVVGDAATTDGLAEGSCDLVTMLEALHDMGDPVGALRAARRALRTDGAVLVADQLTRDAFAADGDPMERFQYACSVLHCLPATRAEEHVTAHGTVVRSATVQGWAEAAGFARTSVLPIEDPFWRFYRLDVTDRS
jgi:SAM-dependent methyltransferase